MMVNRISMIGLGYIGLPTAALFASRGTCVIGVDVSQHVVDTVNAGKIHILEPELDGLVQKAVLDGMLSATCSPEPSDAFIIAVPTPLDEDNLPDLSGISSAAAMIAPVLEPGNLVILESTSPVGTTQKLAHWLAAARPDLSFPQDAGDDADIQVAYCPERVLPGHVVRELVENDRVIGGLSARATDMASQLYRLVVKGACIHTDAQTAEMCKLVENSSRDVQIAFANELSIICDKFGIDVWELISLANRHPRVDILQPSAGVGGHCIAVDPWFIVASAPQDASLIRAARLRNDSKPDWVVEKGKAEIMKVLSANPKRAMRDVKVACLGLAFKPDIDDLRESPALEITRQFAELGCQILAVEPNIKILPEVLDGGNSTLIGLECAVDQADIVIILVKHLAFKNVQKLLPEHAKVIDIVGIL